MDVNPEWMPILFFADGFLIRLATLVLAAGAALARRASRPTGLREAMHARQVRKPAERFLPCHRACIGLLPPAALRA